MKTALFGGSFNPVHKEHVNIARAAISSLGLDRLIVIPSHITPAKTGRMAVSDSDRLNMCRLAFGDMEKAEVSDYEIRKGGISYSYLTCNHFRQKYPNDELYFIMGADMLESFPSWKNPQEILKCVTLAVCGREQPLKDSSVPCVNINYVGGEVSSTRIRTLAALGESVEQFVGSRVSGYIKDNQLYSLKELLKVKKYLTPERWQHTVRVAIMAAENCARENIPEITAVTAAALHDCAKYLKPDSAELRGFVCPDGVPEPVIHQYSGAYVAEHTFGIKDEQIIDAIKYHTSGRENMTALGKLIFLSDMLEEERSFDGIQKLREQFSRSLDKGLLAALKHQTEYLKSTGKPVYPLTQRAYEYALKKGN